MRFSVVLLLTACGCLAGSLGPAVASERPDADAPLRAIDDPGGEGESSTTRLGGFAHISKRILQYLLNRDVTYKEIVSELILNMTTRGTAGVDCQIGLDLVPNPRAANLRLSMTGGVIMDDAVSTLRSVQIFSSSQTRISGYKDVLLDAQGLHLLPSRASGCTSIQVHDIDSRRRFVERLAWRRVGAMQAQTEHAAGLRAARRAEQQLESEVGKPLGQLQHLFVENVFRPLSDQSAFPDARLATTSDHLSVRLIRRAALAEHSPLATSPPMPAYDLAVCLNDSFVNEMTTPLLAGRTRTDRHFADFMQAITGTTPRPLWVHARTERWSVTAAKERPLVISFAEDAVSVTLRIDHAERGQERLDRALAISAKYTLESTPDGPHLIRRGDLSVEFTEADAGERAEPRETEFRKFLERKFSGVFLKDLYFDGLTPPEGGSWGKLRRLQLKQLSSRDGWLAIGYELGSTSPIVNALTLTIAR